MYTFTPGQRKRKDYFPSLIYYLANPDSIKLFKRKGKDDDAWESEEEEEEEEEGSLEVDSLYIVFLKLIS